MSYRFTLAVAGIASTPSSGAIPAAVWSAAAISTAESAVAGPQKGPAEETEDGKAETCHKGRRMEGMPERQGRDGGECGPGQ